jgi:rubrerythrin
MSSPVSRRRFLAGTGIAAVAAVAGGGCSGDDGERSDAAGAGPPPAPGATVDNDVALAQLAGGLEKLAVDTYTALVTAARDGKLGDVPPAVEELVATAREHHEVHLRSWNTVLKAAGRPEVATPNAALKPTVDRLFEEASDASAAARLALTLENIASHTYNKAIPTVRDKGVVKLAAQMQVVDQQHIAVLRYVLGAYPVGTEDLSETGVAFQPTDKAAAG